MPDLHSRNAYDILGIGRDADAQAVRRAFRKLALMHHPDAVAPEQKAEASQTFARINQAYEILRDPQRRRHYDALLARGITPDLQGEIGTVETPTLAEILGEIRSLGIEDDGDDLMEDVDTLLAIRILVAQVNSGELKEKVIEVLPLAGVVPKDWFGGKWVPDEPGGSLRQGWLVLTDLRAWVLTLREESQGNTRTEIRTSVAVPYLGMKKLQVCEVGRAFASCRLDLETDDGKAYQMTFHRPRLTRLFLVANAYRLPLEVPSAASRLREYARAVLLSGLALLAVLLSLLAFRVMETKYPEQNHHSGTATAEADRADWAPRAGRTLLLGLPLLLAAWLWLRVYRAWSLWQEDAILGRLPPAAVPASVAPPPASEPAPEPQPEPAPLIESQAAGPAPLVEVPDAVREALSLPAPAGPEGDAS
jgi:hypothetical protein